MTCIIGLVDGENVYIGADSAAVAGDQVQRTLLPKVFQVDGVLMGYTSSFRMGQLLQYRLTIPSRGTYQKSEEFIALDLMDAIRECLKDGGFSKIDNNKEGGGTFLLGYNGRLFQVGSGFGVTESADGIDACGCGQEFALGAMMALEGVGPVERITKALEITAHLCGGVAPPFHVLKLEQDYG